MSTNNIISVASFVKYNTIWVLGIIALFIALQE